MESRLKLPRKIKKALKKAILKDIDPNWKSKEVRIDRVSKTSYPSVKKGFATYKGFIVESFRLI